MRDLWKKVNLILVASAHARTKPESPLLRLARDHSELLAQFRLHTTPGTASRLYGTGLFSAGTIKGYRAAQDGGMAQLAALIARGECDAAILLMDPSDPSCDAVETRALKRVAIQLRVRLITTSAAARRWLTLEADLQLKRGPTHTVQWKPSNWRLGHSNVVVEEEKSLTVDKRTIALISHDKKKLQMVRFAKDNISLLEKHDRLLATGTTGWLLKLLFCEFKSLHRLLAQVVEEQLQRRLIKVTGDLLEELRFIPTSDDLAGRINELRKRLGVRGSDRFAENLMPLPSGPHGGDVLVAEAIRENKCHSVIFFHDPETAHPHSADIRLLENTAQLPGVYCECVSDEASAQRWIRGLEVELGKTRTRVANLAQRLRLKEGLQEVIAIQRSGDKDSDSLGRELARAAAGYFNQRLQFLASQQSELRIGVSWGWGSLEVLQELVKMKKEGLLELPDHLPTNLVWSPLIGTITAEVSDREACVIAEGFSRFYGGVVEDIPGAGFTRRPVDVQRSVKQAIAKLESADIILTSASPWNQKASLYRNTGLNPKLFPDPQKAAGLVSGVFLDHEGRELSGEYVVVGLDFCGFQAAAKRGAVILICGGEGRRAILRAALKAKVASVVVTTQLSLRHILDE